MSVTAGITDSYDHNIAVTGFLLLSLLLRLLMEAMSA